MNIDNKYKVYYRVEPGQDKAHSGEHGVYHVLFVTTRVTRVVTVYALTLTGKVSSNGINLWLAISNRLRKCQQSYHSKYGMVYEHNEDLPFCCCIGMLVTTSRCPRTSVPKKTVLLFVCKIS